jgi:hypothetical protein
MPIELFDVETTGGTDLSPAHNQAFWTWAEALTNETNDLGPVGDLVSVASVDDFPEADGLVINLDPGKRYLLRGDVDLGNKVLAGTSVAMNGLGFTITTASTSPLITATGRVGLLEVNMTNFIGPAFHFDIPTDQLFMRGCIITAKRSTIESIPFAIFVLVSFVGLEGMLISGTMGTLLMTNCQFVSLTGSITAMEVAVGSTFEIFDVHVVRFQTVAGQTGLFIPDSVPKPTSGGQFSINIFEGTGTHLETTGGIDPNTVGWRFIQNGKHVSDSAFSGDISMEGNPATTVLTNPDEYKPITIGAPAVWTLGLEAARFSQPSPGVLQYDGDPPLLMRIDLGTTLEASSGTNKEYKLAAESDTGGGFTLLPASAFQVSYRSVRVSSTKPFLHTMVSGEKLRIVILKTGATPTDPIVNTAWMLAKL